MQRIFSSDRIRDLNMGLTDRYHLSAEQTKALVGIEIALIGREYGPDKAFEHIVSELLIKSTMAKEFAREFLGQIALPLAWHIGNVDSLIRELGGNPDQYLAAAKQRFPESYATVPVPVTPPPEQGIPSDTSSLLDHFDDRLTTRRGQAEILLRLVGLSAQVEDAIGSGKLATAEGEELIRELDALSNAINTQSLNPLEVQAVKRRLGRVLDQLGS